MQYDEEENFDSLPSLPSSTPGSTVGSRAPSVNDDKDEDDGFVSAAQSPFGSFVDEHKPFVQGGYFDLPEDKHQHDDIEFLDSQQVTPKASALGPADGDRDVPELDLGLDDTMIHHAQEVVEEDSVLSPQDDLKFVTPFESNAFRKGSNAPDDGDGASKAQSSEETEEQKTSSFFPTLSAAVATAASAVSQMALSSDPKPSAAIATESESVQLVEHEEIDSSVDPQAVDLPDVDESWTQYNRSMSKKDKKRARKQGAQTAITDTTLVQPAAKSNTTLDPKSGLAQGAESIDDLDKRSEIRDLESGQSALDDGWAQQARPMSKKDKKKARKQTNHTVEADQNELSLQSEQATEGSAQPELYIPLGTADPTQQQPADDIWPEINRPLSNKEKKKAKKLANRSPMPEDIDLAQTELAPAEAPRVSEAAIVENDPPSLDSNWSIPSRSKKDKRKSKKSSLIPRDETTMTDDATSTQPTSDTLALAPELRLPATNEEQASIPARTSSPTEMDAEFWHGGKLSKKDKKKAKRQAKQADQIECFSATSGQDAGDNKGVPRHSSVTAHDLQPENIALPEDDSRAILDQLQPAEVPLPRCEDDDLKVELQLENIALPDDNGQEIVELLEPAKVPSPGFNDDDSKEKPLQPAEVPLPKSKDDDLEEKLRPERVPLPGYSDDDLEEHLLQPTAVPLLGSIDNDLEEKLRPEAVPLPYTSSEDLIEESSPEEVPLPYSDDEDLLNSNLPEDVLLAHPDRYNTLDTMKSPKTTEDPTDPKVVALPEPDDEEAKSLANVEDMTGQTGSTLAGIQNGTKDIAEASLGQTDTTVDKDSHLQSSSSQPSHVETTVPSAADQFAPEINLDPACLPLSEADEEEVKDLENLSPVLRPLPKADEKEVRDLEDVSPVLLPLPKADGKEVRDLEDVPPVLLPLPKADEEEVKDLDDISTYMDNDAVDILHATNTKPSTTLLTEAKGDEWAFPIKAKKGKKGKINRAVSEPAIADETGNDLATKALPSSDTQEITADDVTARRMEFLEREIPPPSEIIAHQSIEPEDTWSGSFITKKKKDKKGKKGRKSYVEEEQSHEKQLPRADVPALTEIDGLDTTEGLHADSDLGDPESFSASRAKDINDTYLTTDVQPEAAPESTSYDTMEMIDAARSNAAAESEPVQDVVLPEESEAIEAPPDDGWAYPIKTKKDNKSKKGKTAATMPEQSETPPSPAEMTTAPETPIEIEEDWATSTKKSKNGKKAKLSQPLYDEPKASPATVETRNVPQSPAPQVALTSNHNLEDEWATTSKKGKKGKKNRTSSAAFDIAEPQGSSSRQVEDQPENLPIESLPSSTPVNEAEDAWPTRTKKGKKGKKAKSRGTPFSWDPEPEVKNEDREAESLLTPAIKSDGMASNRQPNETLSLDSTRNEDEDVAVSQVTGAGTPSLADHWLEIDPALVPLPESEPAPEIMDTDNRVLPEDPQETEHHVPPLPTSPAEGSARLSTKSREEAPGTEAALVELSEPTSAETHEPDVAMLDPEPSLVPAHDSNSNEHARQHQDNPLRSVDINEHETDKHKEQTTSQDGIVRKLVDFLTPAVLLASHDDTTSRDQTEALDLEPASIAVPKASDTHEQQNDLAHTKPIVDLDDYAGSRNAPPPSETQIGDKSEGGDDAEAQPNSPIKRDPDIEHDRPKLSMGSRPWNESYVDRWANVADVIAAQGDEDRMPLEDDMQHDDAKSAEGNALHRQSKEVVEASQEENADVSKNVVVSEPPTDVTDVTERDKTIVNDDDYSTMPISKKKKKKSKSVEREVYWWSVSEPAEKETEGHAPVVPAEATSLNSTKQLGVTENDDVANGVYQTPFDNVVATVTNNFTSLDQTEVPVSTAGADDWALPSSSKKKKKGKKGRYQALDVFAEAFEQAVHPAEEAITESADQSGSIASTAPKGSLTDEMNKLHAGEEPVPGIHDDNATVENTIRPERPVVMEVEEATQLAKEDMPEYVPGIAASPPPIVSLDKNTSVQPEDGKVEDVWPGFIVKNKRSKKKTGKAASTRDDMPSSAPTFDTLVATTLVSEGFNPSLIAEQDDNFHALPQTSHDALEGDGEEALRRASSVSRRRRSRENSQDRSARLEERSVVSRKSDDKPADLPEASFEDIISSQLAAAGFDRKQLDASGALESHKGVEEINVRSSSPTSPSQLWQTSSRPASHKYLQDDPEEFIFSTKPNKKKKSRKDEVAAWEPSQDFTMESWSANLQDQESVPGEIPEDSAATEKSAPQEKQVQQDSIDEKASQNPIPDVSEKRWSSDNTSAERRPTEPVEALRSPHLDTVFEEDPDQSFNDRSGILHAASETARRIFSSSDTPRDSLVAYMRASTTDVSQPILITKQRMTSSPSTSEMANTRRQSSRSVISPLPSPGYTQARYSPTASIMYNRSRSVTPSLRRTDRKLSGDLRVLSQQGEGSNVGTTTSTTSQNKRETSDYDPLRGSGNSRMSDVSQQHVSICVMFRVVKHCLQLTGGMARHANITKSTT